MIRPRGGVRVVIVQGLIWPRHPFSANSLYVGVRMLFFRILIALSITQFPNRKPHL